MSPSQTFELISRPTQPTSDKLPFPENIHIPEAQQILNAIKHPIFTITSQGDVLTCNTVGEALRDQINPDFLQTTIDDSQLVYVDGRLHKPVITPLSDNQITHFVFELIDIHDDYIDVTTGLPNAAYLSAEKNRLEKNIRDVKYVIVLVSDLNGLNVINATQGHPVGNKALKITADTIVKNIRPGDPVARTGGDEMTAFLPSDGSEIPDSILNDPELIKDPEALERKILDFKLDQALEVARRIENAVKETKLEDGNVQLSTSVGYAVAARDPSGRLVLQSAIKTADENSYVSKRFHYLFDDPNHQIHKR